MAGAFIMQGDLTQKVKEEIGTVQTIDPNGGDLIYIRQSNAIKQNLSNII